MCNSPLIETMNVKDILLVMLQNVWLCDFFKLKSFKETRRNVESFYFGLFRNPWFLNKDEVTDNAGFGMHVDWNPQRVKRIVYKVTNIRYC